MEIQSKRSKFKKTTITYRTDNVLDIIDIPDTLSKNRSIPKISIDKFIYEKNLKDQNYLLFLRRDSIKTSQILNKKNYKETINFEKLNKNPFNINFKNLKLEYPNGYSILFIEAFYPLEIIGAGSFGLVISVIDLETEQKLAIKIVDKTENNIFDLKILNNEVNILKKLSNPRILNVYEVLDTPKYFFIFMELIEGGSLKDLIIRRYNNKKEDYLFKDSECSIIIKGILEAVEFLHQNNIIHRDLKPENIMFKKKNNLDSIILCDFGLAYHLDNNLLEKLIQGTCGTTLYMAPEIIEKRKYDYLVDLFSIGIILYVLVSGGKHPIYKKKMTHDEYIKELHSLKLNKEKFDFPSYFPLLARNLFLKLCKFEPFFRYSTFKALKHPWITRSEKGQIPLTLVDEYEKCDKINQFKALLTSFIFFPNVKKIFSYKIKNKNNNVINSDLFLKLNNNENENFKKISTSSRNSVKNMNFVFQPNPQSKQNLVNYKKNTPEVQFKNNNEENESSNETSYISNPSQNKSKGFLKTHSNLTNNIHNFNGSNSKSIGKNNNSNKKRSANKLRELSNYKSNQTVNSNKFTPLNGKVGKKINKEFEQGKSRKKF